VFQDPQRLDDYHSQTKFEPLCTPGYIIDNRYEIVSVIASGATGDVFEVTDLAGGTRAALKILRQKLNPAAKDNLIREGKRVFSLKHQNIVSIYDFGCDPFGRPYFAMEYVDGVSLARTIEREGYIPQKMALEVFTQLAEALSYAHDHDIIHRNLKPSNIMLVKTSKGYTACKILDFGVTKLLDNDNYYALKEENIQGQYFANSYYMSPEQCTGGHIDARTDVYSLGCVMYETLTSRAPLPTNGIMQAIQDHIHGVPLPFADVLPNVQIAPALERIVFRCMEKESDKRFSSMLDLARALHKANNKLRPADRTLNNQEAADPFKTQPLKPSSKPAAATAADHRATIPPGQSTGRRTAIPAGQTTGRQTAAAPGFSTGRQTPIASRQPVSRRGTATTGPTVDKRIIIAAGSMVVIAFGMLGSTLWSIYKHKSAKSTDAADKPLDAGAPRRPEMRDAFNSDIPMSGAFSSDISAAPPAAQESSAPRAQPSVPSPQPSVPGSAAPAVPQSALTADATAPRPATLSMEEVRPKVTIKADLGPLGNYMTEELVNKADELLRFNQPRQALPLYAEALQRPDIADMDPIRIRALSGQTSALNSLNLFDTARGAGHKWLEIQLKQNDKRSLALCYYQLGTAYRCGSKTADDSAKAIEYFKKAVWLDEQAKYDGPEVSAFYMGIGLTLSDQGKYDQALESYKKQLAFCLQHKNPNWQLQTALAHFYCGRSYDDLKKPKLAVEEFEQAIPTIRKRLSKETAASIYSEMSMLYNKLGNKKRSEECRDAAEKLQPRQVTM
jgi:serine/threonine-protein kinase